MGIEDEETRAVKAVQRKVTDVQTRKVNAVKRKPVEADAWSSFLVLQQADVLRRGALLNEAGEKDEGWVFREPIDKTDLMSFVFSAEAALATLKRWLEARGPSYDVMFGGECVAVLEFQPLWRDRDASARLLSPRRRVLAQLELKSVHQSVECFAGTRSVLLLEQSHPIEASLLAGKRSIGKLHRRPQPGILITTHDLEVSFDRGATGFQRLCGATMIVMQDAWRLAPRYENSRTGKDPWD